MNRFRIGILALVLALMLATTILSVTPARAGDLSPQSECIPVCEPDPYNCPQIKPLSECPLWCEMGGTWYCRSGWTCVAHCTY